LLDRNASQVKQSKRASSQSIAHRQIAIHGPGWRKPLGPGIWQGGGFPHLTSPCLLALE
jgi:hypothetical protein